MLERAFDANPHGWGLAWFERGDKPDRTPNSWYSVTGMSKKTLLRHARQNIDINHEALVHCRIASCGTIKPSNAHPFPMRNNGGLLMHNGTLSFLPLKKNGTDSEAFAAWLDSISNLNDLLLDPEWTDNLSELIGYSKIAIMSTQRDDAGKVFPHVVILNSELGEWKDGLWASNGSAFRDPIVISNSKYFTTSDPKGLAVSGYKGTPSFGYNPTPRTSSLAVIADEDADEAEREALLSSSTLTATTSACLDATDVFEACDSIAAVERLVRERPHMAALALWYYHELMGN